VLLGNAHAGMAEKDRDLVVGNASQQHLDGKGIAEYVAVGALGRQRHEDRYTGLGLIEHQFDVGQPRALQGGRVAYANAAFLRPQERSAICDRMVKAAGAELRYSTDSRLVVDS